MSTYPTMDQYNDAVQHPQTAFVDASLKASRIATNGMGLPIALGGGFALTYTATAQGRKYAVRCFHKEAKGLEERYAHVARGLRAAGGQYFVGFEYQPQGITVNGQRYPIVRMDWVEGDTLGSFLEDNHGDKSRVEVLRQQFTSLEQFLRSKGIAHGDLQNGNVLVKSGLKLIDYDGVYVPTLPAGKGTELGHRHFQHPKRSAADFGPHMDRFSFIVIDLSLRALSHDARLFSRYSNGENILLTANDFLDPGTSPAFADLKAIPALAKDTASLASICVAPLKDTPTLEDFLGGKNIPAAAIVIGRPKPATARPVSGQAAYVGAYDVLDASNFRLVAKQVGNRVELVGIVTKVHVASTKYGKPYCFVFFNNSREAVKLNIWSEGLAKLTSMPSKSWVGTWFSVQGLIDPPYTSSRYGTSLSITVTTSGQLRKITEQEARYRLKSPSTSGIAVRPASTDNSAILRSLDGDGKRTSASSRSSVPPRASQSRNQAILSTVQQTPPPASSSRVTPPAYRPTQPTRQIPWGKIIIGAVVLYIILRALRVF